MINATEEKLAADVLDIIGRTENGEAISYVISELRFRGWKNIPRETGFFEKLGFKARLVWSGRYVRATYITL